jgi:hypothetical protein
MKSNCLSGVLSGIFAFVSATGHALASNELTPAEKKAGYVLLFDGKDKNASWRHGESGNAASKWTVEDSAMRTVDEYSFLCTKSTLQYSNFEWKIDWKLARGGNSGLFIRVATSTYNDGYEYGILDDANGGDRNERSNNVADRLPDGKGAYVKRNGSAYDMYPTTRNGQVGGQYYDSTFSVPLGQWDKGVVFANGNFIEHWLNGKKVVEFEIGSTEWNARFVKSKWNATAKVGEWARRPTGSLCMQAHGDGADAWFRNIKIRPFTPGEKLNSPLITPAGGAFQVPVTVFLDPAITGSTVRYTLDGTDPTAASPVYKDSLKISATAVIKTVTFRDKFLPSDVATATFTIGGTGIAFPKSYPGARYAYSSKDRTLRIENASGLPMELDVKDVSGATRLRYATSDRSGVVSLSDLRAGIYFIQARSGGIATVNRIHAF